MEERFLRVAEITLATGLSRSTLWRLERRGEFPHRYQLGPNSVGWRESQVNTWLKNRPRR